VFANVAPAGLTATLKVAAVFARLHTFNVLAMVLVLAGTVYNVVAVVADGFCCPKTL
jgi:hypothetical protein